MPGKQITRRGFGKGGFTLIELMFVVVIIGIIASITIPNYNNYRDNAIISEALTLPRNIQLDVSEYYGHHGHFPADNAALGLPEPGQLIGSNINSIEVQDGALHIRFSGDVAERIKEPASETSESGKSVYLTLRPSISEAALGGGSVSWLCGYAEAVEAMKIYGKNKTNVKRESLPMVCW